MAHGIAALSSERHYMGSFTSGAYATNRDLRPDYDTRPSEETRARWQANELANRTRYLREQDVLGLVIDCHEAKEELALIDAKLSGLQETAGQKDAPQGSEAASVLEAITLLEARHVEALAVRQALSSQLRSLGISPKEEAEIWRELTRREAEEASR